MANFTGSGSVLSRRELKLALAYPLPASLFNVMAEPAHDFVYYQPGFGCTYIQPTTFYWGRRRSPSDCVWMIPGTERRRY